LTDSGFAAGGGKQRPPAARGIPVRDLGDGAQALDFIIIAKV